MKIGFIGLGNMGRPMARHLILAVHDVTVHDVRAEAGLDHLNPGARWVDSPAGPAASNFLENDVLSVLADGDYDDSFAMVLACKDLGLAVDLAGEMSPVRLCETWAGQDFRLSLPTVPAV
ncbi:NAD(P)-binding domain-containing protein [Amycolatopsis vastitatis]|uniref:6-phosphogluconate dehydrogenase NADP-binding domain-containing protein n=1 Tax=Amycolatopsis vastitatis TaxID=1905142 RepID=A0A229T6D8_9PSEU|nr:NAD(P)-binding domain-containing protein [Amycolatopsis vastitatis]OXM66319.1 hypothetical protein CF165_20415 [Amycolatopsis vastitatis]